MILQTAGSMIAFLSVVVQASSMMQPDSRGWQRIHRMLMTNTTSTPRALLLQRCTETSEDLLAEAESLLADFRPTETTASHNFQMLEQSLKDDRMFNAQDLGISERSLAETQIELITDNADLRMTEDALAEDSAALEDAKQDCQAQITEFEGATKSWSKDLEVLAKTRTVLQLRSFTWNSSRSVFHCAKALPNARL